MHKGLAVLLLCFGCAAHAASFNCAKAATLQEKAICASPQLSAADEHMAAIYRALLAHAPAEVISEIREGQRAWVRSMASACPATPYITECLQRYEETRATLLQHMMETHGRVTFVWRSVSLIATENTPPADESRPDGPGTLNASWPQALAPGPDWAAWNKAMVDVAQMLASAGNAKPGDAWNASWTDDEDIDVSTTLGVVNDVLVTATVQDFWYGHGAAHPNTGTMQFNWLLHARRELKAEDVFRAGSGWDKTLQQFCDRDLHQKLDVDGQSYESFVQAGEMQKTVRGIVTAPASWLIDGEGITIVWQPYAVACYACTPEPTLIPWSVLKPYLNPAFSAPTNP